MAEPTDGQAAASVKASQPAASPLYRSVPIWVCAALGLGFVVCCVAAGRDKNQQASKQQSFVKFPLATIGQKPQQAPNSAPLVSPSYAVESKPLASPAPKHSTAQSSGTGYNNQYYDYNYRPPVGNHFVQEHYRSNGTHVKGHYQTNRDNSFWNNWGSKGNVNPYTGKIGTKQPPAFSSPRRR